MNLFVFRTGVAGTLVILRCLNAFSSLGRRLPGRLNGHLIQISRDVLSGTHNSHHSMEWWNFFQERINRRALSLCDLMVLAPHIFLTAYIICKYFFIERRHDRQIGYRIRAAEWARVPLPKCHLKKKHEKDSSSLSDYLDGREMIPFDICLPLY